MSGPLDPVPRRSEWIPGAVFLVFQQLFLAGLLQGLGIREDAALNGVFYLLSILAVAGIFWRFLTESLSLVPREPGRLFRGMLLGLCVYELTQVGLGILYDALIPGLETPNDQGVVELARTHFPLVLVLTVLISPLLEETLYRGMIFGLIRRRSRAGAYILSSLVFAAAHLADYFGSTDLSALLLNVPLYALPGAVLCFCYERSGNIWGPILLHGLINALAMIAVRG